MPRDGWHRVELPETGFEVEVYAEFEVSEARGQVQLEVHVCDMRPIAGEWPDGLMAYFQERLLQQWKIGDFEE